MSPWAKLRTVPADTRPTFILQPYVWDCEVELRWPSHLPLGALHGKGLHRSFSASRNPGCYPPKSDLRRHIFHSCLDTLLLHNPFAPMRKYQGNLGRLGPDSLLVSGGDTCTWVG